MDDGLEGPEEDLAPVSGGMEYARLGEGDDEISRVGFGCWAIGGHGYGAVDEGESVRAIREALDRGINFFDTADVYGFGRSEEVLSKGLGARRKDVVIATKFGVCWDGEGRTYKDSSAARAVTAIEGSLRRLGVERIPLYQVHYYDGASDIGEMMEALLRLRDEGKVGMIGCSNLSPPLVDAMSRAGRVSAVQMLYGIGDRENGEQLRCHHDGHGMATLAYGALVRGLLSGKYDEGTTYGHNDTRSRDANFKGERLSRNLRIARALESVAGRYGKTPAQVAVRWVLDSPFISSAIVGMKTAAQVADNAGAAGWSMSPEDRSGLSADSGGE